MVVRCLLMSRMACPTQFGIISTLILICRMPTVQYFEACYELKVVKNMQKKSILNEKYELFMKGSETRRILSLENETPTISMPNLLQSLFEICSRNKFSIIASF